MIYIERLTRPATGLDLADTRLFLRDDSEDENATIQEMIDAAAHELEDAAEIALINQMVRVTVEGWPDSDRIRLPIGPVLSDDPQFQVMADGALIDAELITGKRPTIVLGDTITEYLRHARFVIEYQAGFGATAEALPPDIQHAIRDQVAQAFDYRGGHAGEGKVGLQARGTAGQCYAMQRVIGRYRGVRA